MLGVLSLLSIGMVMVTSAGLSVAPDHAVTFSKVILSRSTVYMLIALAVMLAASRIPLQQLISARSFNRAVPWLLIAIILTLLLVYAPLIGHEVNGSNRWLILPGSSLTFQPSELAKWGMILVVAWLGVRHASVMHSFRSGLIPALTALALVVAVVTLEDLGTGLLILATGFVVLAASGARLTQLALVIPLGLAGLGVAVITSPYRVRRLATFFNPYENPSGDGYHMINSLVAIANGNGFGRGLGFGLQKFGYLPEDQTDFLFAIMCEELGIAGAALVMFLYLLIIYAGVNIVRKQQSALLKLVGLGIVTTFGLQAAMNIFVVLGLAPTKGIALPLLSAGGTGWILTAGALGLLAAMDRIAQQPTPTPPAPA